MDHIAHFVIFVVGMGVGAGLDHTRRVFFVVGMWGLEI